jgi:hypothetical protein
MATAFTIPDFRMVVSDELILMMLSFLPRLEAEGG